MEFVLDVERRDSPVVVELRDTLDAHDADAVGTRCSEVPSDVNLTKGVQETAQRVARDAIKFVNDEHHSLSIQDTPQFLEEIKQRELIAVDMSVFQKTA